jgi:hypothetical protein
MLDLDDSQALKRRRVSPDVSAPQRSNFNSNDMSRMESNGSTKSLGGMEYLADIASAQLAPTSSTDRLQHNAPATSANNSLNHHHHHHKGAHHHHRHPAGSSTTHSAQPAAFQSFTTHDLIEFRGSLEDQLRRVAETVAALNRSLSHGTSMLAHLSHLITLPTASASARLPPIVTSTSIVASESSTHSTSNGKRIVWETTPLQGDDVVINGAPARSSSIEDDLKGFLEGLPNKPAVPLRRL